MNKLDRNSPPPVLWDIEPGLASHLIAIAKCKLARSQITERQIPADRGIPSAVPDE